MSAWDELADAVLTHDVERGRHGTGSDPRPHLVSPLVRCSVNEPRISIDTEATCTCRGLHPHLDEFWLSGDLAIHFEAMDESAWWIGVTDHATGRSWRIDCGAVNHNARGYAICEET